MGADEFVSMIKKAKIYSDDFGESQIASLYNLSFMTQVDELSKSRFTEMYALEFFEALTRVADMCPFENLKDYYPTHVS